MKEKEFEKLVSKYKNMIYSIIRKYYIKNNSVVICEQDLFQEGLIALYDAQKSYSEKENVSFSTFAYVLIKRRIVKTIIKYNLIYYNETVHYDNFDKSDYYFQISYSNSKINEYKDIINSYSKTCNEEEKQILNLYLSNNSYKNIANKLNCSVKYVDNRLQKMKKDLNFYAERVH